MINADAHKLLPVQIDEELMSAAGAFSLDQVSISRGPLTCN